MLPDAMDGVPARSGAAHVYVVAAFAIKGTCLRREVSKILKWREGYGEFHPSVRIRDEMLPRLTRAKRNCQLASTLACCSSFITGPK